MPYTLELVADNNTRWNSFFYEPRRAVQEKVWIANLMQKEHRKRNGIVAKDCRSGRFPDGPKRPSILDCTLASEDWQIINNHPKFLQSWEEATVILQGHGKSSSCGVNWQVVSVMEVLLKQFGQLKSQNVVTSLLKTVSYVGVTRHVPASSKGAR
jgi:hypothetical protein